MSNDYFHLWMPWVDKAAISIPKTDNQKEKFEQLRSVRVGTHVSLLFVQFYSI